MKARIPSSSLIIKKSPCSMQRNHLHLRGLHSFPPKRRPQLHLHHHRWQSHMLPRWCGHTYGLPGALQTRHKQCSFTKGSTLFHIGHQKIIPRHPSQPTQICQNTVIRHSPIIHRQVWLGEPNTRWMGLLRNPQGSLWFTPIRKIANDLLRKLLGIAG